MPPLFACAGCGLQIERSVRSYVQQKGRLLCSTCLDRSEQSSDQPSQASAAALKPDSGLSGGSLPG